MELLIIISFSSQTKPSTADVWPCSYSSWLQMFSPWLTDMLIHHLAQKCLPPSQMTQTAYSDLTRDLNEGNTAILTAISPLWDFLKFYSNKIPFYSNRKSYFFNMNIKNTIANAIRLTSHSLTQLLKLFTTFISAVVNNLNPVLTTAKLQPSCIKHECTLLPLQSSLS